MSENELDPFAPQERGNKTRFGKLKLFASPVRLVKVAEGGVYTIPGIFDRDGNVKEWRGKKVDKSSKKFHIVMHLKAEDRDGNEYGMARDALASDDEYKNIIFPALKKVFGEDLPRDKYVFVKVEEVPTGETFASNRPETAGQDVSKTTWKVVARYANEKACKAAEEEFFAQFSNGNGSESTSASEDGPVFSADMIKAFKKNSKKGAESIVDELVEDEVIEQFGRDVVIEAVKAVL